MDGKQAVKSFKKFLAETLDGEGEVDLVDLWNNTLVGAGVDYEVDEDALEAVAEYIDSLVGQLYGYTDTWADKGGQDPGSTGISLTPGGGHSTF